MSIMYKLKPVFNISNEFKHTSSMYKLKKLNPNLFSNVNYPEQKEQIDIELLSNESILQRQERLLSELLKLQTQLSSFRFELNKQKEKIFTSQNDVIDLFRKVEMQDLVINADPKYPPFGLLWLQKLWNLPLNISIHVHSSVPSLPEHLVVFNRLKVDDSNNMYCITFVWKTVGPDLQMIASPIKNKIIRGEVNILKFFDMILSEDNLVERTKKNEILDITHRLNHALNEEIYPLINKLSKFLGNNQWFNQYSHPTIIDAAVWSVLLRITKLNSLPSNLVKWNQLCSSFIGMNLQN